MTSHSASSLSADRNFRLFWLGQAVSTTGDAFAFVAMPLLVLEVTGSVTQMGSVTAVTCAGQIAMSVVAGLIVDRARRRELMILCDLGRLAIYAALPVAWWLGAPSLWLIYAVAGIASALGNLFLVGYVTAVANVVDRDKLAEANGRLQATQALTYALGPVAAGVLCARSGPVVAMLVDAASFGVSALSLFAVRFRKDRAERAADTHGGGPIAEMRVGLQYLARQPVLRAMTAIMVIVGLLASAGLSAAVVDLMVFHLRSDLGQSSRVVGVCLGVAATGALGGALGAARLKHRLGFGSCFLGGTALQGLGLVLAGQVAGVVATCLGAMLWAMGLTLRGVSAVSMRQELVPDSLLGRVTAASWTMTFGAATMGAILTTQLAAHVGAKGALVVAGAALAVVAGGGAFTPVARAEASALAASRERRVGDARRLR
ncbi:MAG: MFS transporter [Polyangiaceae bacterium]|jgi:MFS family permease